MADVPFPITGDTMEESRYQIYELIRNIYEEKIGGADLGDVFSLLGDVLTLALAGSSGLTKTGNVLGIKLDGTSLSLSSEGLKGSFLPNAPLDASRLAATDADGIVETVPTLTSWVDGTTDEVDVADDGDGSVTVALSPTTTNAITDSEGQIYFGGGR